MDYLPVTDYLAPDQQQRLEMFVRSQAGDVKSLGV